VTGVQTCALPIFLVMPVAEMKGISALETIHHNGGRRGRGGSILTVDLAHDTPSFIEGVKTTGFSLRVLRVLRGGDPIIRNVMPEPDRAQPPDATDRSSRRNRPRWRRQSRARSRSRRHETGRARSDT